MPPINQPISIHTTPAMCLAVYFTMTSLPVFGNSHVWLFYLVAKWFIASKFHLPVMTSKWPDLKLTFGLRCLGIVPWRLAMCPGGRFPGFIYFLNVIYCVVWHLWSYQDFWNSLVRTCFRIGNMVCSCIKMVSKHVRSWMLFSPFGAVWASGLMASLCDCSSNFA